MSLLTLMGAGPGGSGGGGGSSLLLDEAGLSGATGAWSTRKLRSAYAGSALRVRRSSDSTESDVGFSGNDLDTAAMLTFCGAGDGFVVTWYDQSGNARNYSNSTAAAQPKIVAAGVTLTGPNGKPVLRFDGTDDTILAGTTLASFIVASAWTGWTVFKTTAINTDAAATYTNDAVIGETGGYWGMGYLKSTGPGAFVFNWDGTDDSASVTIDLTNYFLVECRHEAGSIYISKNALADSSAASGDTTSLAGTPKMGVGQSNQYLVGDIVELVLYNTALSAASRTTGRANINTYYAIY